MLDSTNSRSARFIAKSVDETGYERDREIGREKGSAKDRGKGSEGEKITVLIADDQELVRSGFAAILGTYPDFEVVGLAKNGVEAVDKAICLAPDVVLMDIRMPEKDGLAATHDITSMQQLADTHVLVLTTFDIDQYVYDALRAGASGFLLKDADPDEMANAIKVVAKGDALIQPSVMRRLVETFVAAQPQEEGSGAAYRPGSVSLSSQTAASPSSFSQALSSRSSQTAASAEYAAAMRARLKQLTDREREILSLVARGLSNDQIGEALFISPATVKTHVARIMSKAQAHDRAQLVVFAYESGLMKSPV